MDHERAAGLMRVWIRRILGLVVILEGLYACGLAAMFFLLGPSDPETLRPELSLSVPALAAFAFSVALIVAGGAMTLVAGRRFDRKIAIVVVGLQTVATVIGILAYTPLLIISAATVGVVVAGTLWLPDRHCENPVRV